MRVSVEGTRRIEQATVLAAIGLRSGQVVTPERVRRDLKSVYATGFFDDIRVEMVDEGGGVALIFTVVEKPAVRDVVISGNKKIDEEDIREILDIRAFAVLNDADVKANTERIRDLYVEKGYFLVDVEPVVVVVNEGQVQLTFRIEENRKVVIHSIEFNGNDNVPDAKIKRFMQTRSGGVVPWLTSKGAFRRELLDQDVYTMRFVFMEEGYVDVRIDEPRVYLSPDKRFIYISINIEEGPRYYIGEFDVGGDFVPEEGLTREAALDIVGGRPVADIQEEQWRQAAGKGKEILDFDARGAALVSGEPFQYTVMQAVVENIATLYKDQGYAFANVVPLPQTDPETQIVNLTFQVDRGEKMRIGRINVTGNDPTFDKVVRREILINEGDVYRGSLIQASRARLNRLGYFEEVTLSTPRGEGDKTLDLNINVAEQPTGSFSFGLGYSNLENLVVTGNIAKNNFLGLGYTLSAAVNWSRLRKQWNVSLFDPYFLDTRWTLQVNAYNITRQFQLDEFQRGGSLSIGRYLDRSDDIRMSVEYTFEDVGLTSLPSPQLLMLGGELYRNGFTSSVGLGLTIDKRNNRIRPTKGIYSSAALELAGGFRISDKEVLHLLGGDFNFVEGRFNFRLYQPILQGNDLLVFRWNTTVAHIQSTDGKVIPYIHRFRAGGINSVRGYDWFSLGPTIRSTISDDPVRADDKLVVGGTSSWINNFEVEAAIVPAAGITGVVFFDAGNAFGDPWGEGAINPLHLRFSFGAGVRWTSPIGPLRFEYGIPINPREGERRAVFDFSIGSFF
ncbi:MAG: outer membrane protein assembly factor BamA [Deltaproteobacteria bacterium]|nr:outer membrane protein assembly factor BamA [Deltaproteobacteria bacterium]